MGESVLSELDTRRFGCRIARAELDEPGAVARLYTHAAAEGTAMTIARCDAGRFDIVHTLEAHGARCMDVLVYYAGATSGFLGERRKSAGRVRKAGADDAGIVSDLASASFASLGGHYHSDPRLDRAASTAGYVEWAVSTLRAQRHEVLLSEIDGVPAGFLALRVDGDAGEIVLNGVRPDLWGQGIYGDLLHDAGTRLVERAVTSVSSSTQLHNVAPQRAWARAGLSPVRSSFTFHCWH